MTKSRKGCVVIGLLGSQLDAGQGPGRWEKWRPTLSVCQHDELLVDRFEILLQEKHTALAETVKEDIATVSPETEVRLHCLDFDDPWDFEEVYGALHDFSRSVSFDPDHEDYLVHITTGSHVAQISLFLLTESRHFPARLLQTSPPPRQRKAVPGEYRIIDLDLSQYDRIAARFELKLRDDLSFLKSGIETRSRRFNELIEKIERVAVRSRAPILLMGPTGAGKSQLARRLFELKKAHGQVEGGFVEVNCATLRGDAAMSALFGHKKGAFTGALHDRKGLLCTADRGILLLDEIGELGPDEQAMLLRALEEKSFLPVGSDREVQSDFQLIAGTNRDLAREVERGKFREDLLARINLWTFRLPPLRERPEDLEPNLDYELDLFTRDTGTRVTMSREARQLFLRFAASPEAAWRANFRDFNAAVTRMGTLAQGGRISKSVVEEEIERLRTLWQRMADRDTGSLLERVLGRDRAAALDRFDSVQLADVLQVCRLSATLSQAGRLLFSQSRSRRKKVNDADRLRKYLSRFDLAWQAVQKGCREFPDDN